MAIQQMERQLGPILNIRNIADDLAVTDISNDLWQIAEGVTIDRYWSGASAPAGRSFSTRLLWSTSALYVRFDANQQERLIVNEKPDTKQKTDGLWDRDVCEIFIAPDTNEPQKYFEFEIAPSGEWLDVAIDSTSGIRVPDWNYASGMETFAHLLPGRFEATLKIPWSALGSIPAAGDVWMGNIFRCIGKDPSRGYLAWQPTMTSIPNFHVPECFGEFRFVK